jgi:hypothetical protein
MQIPIVIFSLVLCTVLSAGETLEGDQFAASLTQKLDATIAAHTLFVQSLREGRPSAQVVHTLEVLADEYDYFCAQLTQYSVWGKAHPYPTGFSESGRAEIARFIQRSLEFGKAFTGTPELQASFARYQNEPGVQAAERRIISSWNTMDALIKGADTAIETDFLKSLKTPALGTTPDDWIALLGEPVKKVQNFGQPVDGKHPTVNDKNLDLIFDHSDVQIWARSFTGIVSDIAFTAKDQKTSKTGFTWNENNIWTVLEQYGIQRFALEEDKWYPGEKRGSHGDFTIHLRPPNLAKYHNTAGEFGSLELVSNSMENAETEEKNNIAKSFIPAGLRSDAWLIPVWDG